MTNLRRLSVSLTKHGAHKVAELIDRLEVDEVIGASSGRFSEINIDAGQARKILSAGKTNTPASFWAIAKVRGRETINSLVLLAIVFSHHELIEAMKNGAEGFGRGTIGRSSLDDGKAYSNTKNDFEILGFATALSSAQFSFGNYAFDLA